MKAWVFNEQQLDQALAEQQQASINAGDREFEAANFVAAIKEFLMSPAAGKLRVAQLDQGNGQT